LKIVILVGCWWLTPVILATREAEIKRIAVRSLPNSSTRPYLKKPFTKIGLAEWLMVKALSSSPSTPPKKKNKQTKQKKMFHAKFLFLDLKM
jgi:hypothetical protein